ncbi:MAG TPA: DNA repair protein RecO [Acholeplasmataceae bacterium]|nr:DNA repair protein RecO [Acholeplasmataceae bacterium]
MMTKQISKGLIYKTQDYKESSKLLFVYTARGKQTLVAKGAKSLKSDLRFLSQYFTLIEFYDSEKTMFDLRGAQLIEPFEEIKKSYEHLKQVSVVLEIIDRLFIEDLPHDKLFELIVSFLSEVQPEIASMAISLKVLYALGYGLNFKGDHPLGFNLEQASVATIENKLPISLDLETTIYLSQLYFMKKEDHIDLTEKSKKQIWSFIKAFYQYHLDYNIKSI